MTWMEVAVRESVINAIKHGNRHDRAKQVTVEFTTQARADARRNWSSSSGTRETGSIPRRSPTRSRPRTC
ncbi:MAG: ATP-binding protein [Ignavibacteriales bacterium]|nr:ATP-binding protein [Ignavibacteriales bacterium]